MFVDHTQPPFIDITLPPAIILPAWALISLYVLVCAIDFFLLRNERHVASIMTPKQLRIGMAIIHILIPMVFITSHPPANVLLAATPWFLASYSAHMPTDQLTLQRYVYTIFKITIDDDEANEPTSNTQVRVKGAAKMALGVFKIAFMHLIIDPLLPRHPDYALEYSWYSTASMTYTVLFGIKAYCMLGIVDVFMGLEQLLFAWNMVTVFNSPIIAYSPRDFWSRRWNRVVRNLLHAQVFKPKSTATTDESKSTLPPSSPTDASTQVALKKEEKPLKKKRGPKKNSAQKTITTTTTTTITTTTKRMTRAAARAAAKAEVMEQEIRTQAEINAESSSTTDTEDEDEQEHDVMVAHDGSTQQQQQQLPKKSFWATRQGRGLLAFIISGIFHELIIMSACRHMTLENLIFFSLQGVAVTLEVQFRQGNLKQEPTGIVRVGCVALQLVFMSITGRLFTGPFLRYHFFPENLV